MTWQQIATELNRVPVNFNTRDVPSLKGHLADIKHLYVAQNDQHRATLIWCLEGVLQVQEKYLEAFRDLQEGKFYAAWCAFERVEVEYSFLRRHLLQPHSRFCLDFIVAKTHQWQSLFPYRLFSSLEFIKGKRNCMTCGQRVSLRNPCGHLIGEIYDGEMCCHEILELNLGSISIVTHPHHKYAVLFTGDKDCDSTQDDRYGILTRVLEQVETPFDEWKTFRGRRAIPREEFDGQDPDSFCRCGSMEYFKECCFHKSEILYPWVHIEIGDLDGYSIPDFLLLEAQTQPLKSIPAHAQT